MELELNFVFWSMAGTGIEPGFVAWRLNAVGLCELKTDLAFPPNEEQEKLNGQIRKELKGKNYLNTRCTRHQNQAFQAVCLLYKELSQP